LRSLAAPPWGLGNQRTETTVGAIERIFPQNGCFQFCGGQELTPLAASGPSGVGNAFGGEMEWKPIGRSAGGYKKKRSRPQAFPRIFTAAATVE